MATPALKSQITAKFTDAYNRLNKSQPGGILHWSQAWVTVKDFLKPRDIKDRNNVKRRNFETARAAFGVIAQCRQLALVIEQFLDEVRENFGLIDYEINEYMIRYESSQNVELIRMLVSRLLDWYKAWMPPAELGQFVLSSYTLTFHTRLFAALPPSFTAGFKSLCAWCLAPEEFPPPSEALAALSPNMSVVWRDFETLGLIERYESVIASVGYDHIEKYVLEVCTGNWERPMMEELRTWMSSKVVPWMLQIYARGASSTEEARAMLQGVGSRFDFHINKTLCDLRTKEIFDIIIDYPDSMGALQDLKECLQRVDQRGALVKALRKANAKRLFHPGADTKLILSQYVSTIKCLRIIDPPGVLLFKVADPVRRYLRERSDTIRSIVSSLVGDDDGDSLVDDNEPIQPLQQVEAEDFSDPMWEPEPIDAGPEFRTNKPSDVISTLVSIYDSKDLFVKELQVLLAQRLLAITDGDLDRVERERKNIEILKIRFGEAALQVCEVMLRDMTDSKRTDTHVQSQQSSVVHPTIISKHFWPALEATDLLMPGQFQDLQESYSKEFTIFKPDKKLKWLPQLGTVHLELFLEDRALEVEVPPLEAAIIELFSQKDTWTLDELVEPLGVDRPSAVKALATWVTMGVLKESSENVFILLELKQQVEDSDMAPPPPPATASALPPVQSVQEQQAEKMRVYWKFIEGMLKNLGSLPIDRIQSMLKLAPGYDQTIDQLSAFMEAARREGLVVSKEGMWKLNT